MSKVKEVNQGICSSVLAQRTEEFTSSYLNMPLRSLSEIIETTQQAVSTPQQKKCR